MLQIKQLDEQVSVGAQITAGDVAALRDAGFTCIMCNRPHGEEANQPDWADITAAASALGMDTRYVPLASRDVTEDALRGFAAAMAQTEGKLFAFCRTGARCEILWNAARQRVATAAE